MSRCGTNLSRSVIQAGRSNILEREWSVSVLGKTERLVRRTATQGIEYYEGFSSSRVEKWYNRCYVHATKTKLFCIAMR